MQLKENKKAGDKMTIFCSERHIFSKFYLTAMPIVKPTLHFHSFGKGYFTFKIINLYLIYIEGFVIQHQILLSVDFSTQKNITLRCHVKQKKIQTHRF